MTLITRFSVHAVCVQVYAVEATDMAKSARQLIAHNKVCLGRQYRGKVLITTSELCSLTSIV